MKRSFAAVLVLVAACGSDEGALSPKSLAGTYALESRTIAQGGSFFSFVPPEASGSLVLTETRYSITMTVSEPTQFHNEILTAEGTYTISGDKITFRPDGSGPADPSQISSDGAKITISNTETVDGQTVSKTMTFVRL